MKAFGFLFYDDSQTLAVEYLSTKTKKFKTCEPKISSASFALARVRFFNGSLRWNFWLFFPNDILRQRCLPRIPTTPDEALHSTCLIDREKEGRKEENKSCKTLNRLRKLVNSNLEILKFEARYAYAVQFFNVSFRLNLYLFSPDDIRCNKA